ncbi:NADH_pyrophosphatase [Hexamita inflata]|uniref:NADH pyrophosphatase n=1 Tax=Hexamita inflata TaxID=28002 RepID=A0AA86N7W3_9EUKA|nr:NADH pyrophosphatase [Hexamita inflata]
MKATFSSLTYCHDGFERVFEPLTAEQIQRALSSALSKIVTFQSETFDILFHDCQYILSIAEIVDLFHVDLKEQYASGNVSLIGYLGDACVFLFKTTQTKKEFKSSVKFLLQRRVWIRQLKDITVTVIIIKNIFIEVSNQQQLYLIIFRQNDQLNCNLISTKEAQFNHSNFILQIMTIYKSTQQRYL